MQKYIIKPDVNKLGLTIGKLVIEKYEDQVHIIQMDKNFNGADIETVIVFTGKQWKELEYIFK